MLKQRPDFKALLWVNDVDYTDNDDHYKKFDSIITNVAVVVVIGKMKTGL